MANETITGDRGAKERATEVAGTAKEQARGVAGEARREASAVASEAGAQARNLVDEARTALHDQAAERTDRAAGALGDLGGRFRALAEGNPDAAGDLRRYAADLGDRLDGLAGRLSSSGFDGVVDDLQRFARRRPGMFLAAAAASGFAAGRLFRGAKAAASDGDRGSQDRELAAGEGPGPVAVGAAGAPSPEAGRSGVVTVPQTPAYGGPGTPASPPPVPGQSQGQAAPGAGGQQ
ncbi:MAG TPA: hypothetical protein VFZ77_25190 [Acidimicrobiales bacterium]